MRWGAPHYLYALILLVPLIGLALWDAIKRRDAFVLWISPVLWPRMAPRADWRAHRSRGLLFALGMAALIVAAARPQWGKKEEILKVTGMDVVLALDVSNSMEVEDVVPTRLKLAKRMMRSLLDRVGGDRVGLVAFAGSAYLASPLTTDLSYVAEILDTVTPQAIVSQGSDLGAGLEVAISALTRAAEDPDDASSTQGERNPEAITKLVVLITDGEDFEERTAPMLDRLKASQAKLIVIGVGTPQGGPVPVRDERGVTLTFKKDARGQSVISQAKPESLQKLAERAEGKYFGLATAEETANWLASEMGALARGEHAERKVTTHEERYQIPLALALLLFGLALAVGRPEASALASALGVALGAGVLLSAIVGVHEARAEGLLPRSVETYLDNEQGIRAYRRGDWEGAKDAFGRAQVQNPRQPALKFNQGTVALEAGQADDAIREYEGVLAQPGAKLPPELEAQTQFNLGKAHGSKKDFGPAIQSYLRALDLAGRLKDTSLERDARKNLELLQIERQQQQKQEQKKEQSKNQPDPQDGKHDQKTPDEPGQGKQPPPQYGQTSKEQRERSFKSQKLSREAAERVMAELSSREKELQGKLKKGKMPPAQGKDW